MGFGLIIFIGIIAFAIQAVQKQATDQSWSTVGRRTGLTTTSRSMFRSPSMSGTIRGVHVDARVVSRGSGDSQRRVTQYTVTFPSVGPPVQFRRQGVGSFLRGMFGGADAVIGDPRFDSSVEIDGADGAALQAFLTPARRAAILSIFSTWPSAVITDSTIRVETRRVERNQDRLLASLNRLVDSARLLGDPGPVNAALAQRDDGDLTDAADALHAAAAADAEPNTVTKVLEAEALIALDRAEEAKPILAAAATELPGDEEVAGWAAVADEQIARHEAASALPAPPPRPEPDAEPDRAPPSLAQQDTIDALFGSSRRGHEIEREFETRYAGETIEWSAEVESSRDYRSDRDFGDEPGTKTTMRIGSVGASTLMSNRVRAIVDLPADSDVDRGDTIAFTGTLLRVDRFTRTIYVADAALL
ncbi:MAG: hypothetical protein R8F63_02490 [Acidimicrobiales bacterium]|nr:hypothetical protein [Acidimicrobiales bacterium]